GTWVARDLASIYARALGEDWEDRAEDPAMWARVSGVRDDDLWAVHERARADLVASIPARMKAHAAVRGIPFDPGALPAPLDPRALTIGFARRFATYKRATLLLRDPDRLFKIVSRADRPVQLVFAGQGQPQQ